MKIIILYNPNSTGDSKQNAINLRRQLQADSLPVEILATQYAGHAEEIAAEFAAKATPIIIISSSGDGGYHEVINGALSSKKSKVITGLLPSGNANDHHSAVSSGSLAKNILTNAITEIDTIAVSATINKKTWKRYAHSYVGIGISATAARDLTVKRPNIVTEKLLVAKSFVLLKPVVILVDGKERQYSSMIFSNIDTMSKMIKLSENSSVTDGKIELNTIGHVSKVRLAQYIAESTTKGLRERASIENYSFTTTTPLVMQLDGEVVTIDKDSKVIVQCAAKNLRCVV